MATTKDPLITSMKFLLMSSGLIFIAITLSLTLPHLLTTSPQLPAIWAALKASLRPPYLCFIINAIIIAIVATSRLHHHAPPPHETSPYAPPLLVKGHHHHHQHDVIYVLADQFPDYVAVLAEDVEVDGVVGDGFYGVVSVQEVVEEEEVKELVECPVAEEVKEVVDCPVAEDEVVVKRDTWTPPPLLRQAELPGCFTERPPVSSRFGHHWRPAKAGVTEGKALRRVAKPKKDDTLESTWKAITEGHHIPLTRHLKKSDTWENHDRPINVLDDASPLPEVVEKSQTFHDRANYSPPITSTMLKKEPSLGQDELNRRVEAFINKFNQEMRLQRQQSAQQFIEMINRAA